MYQIMAIREQAKGSFVLDQFTRNLLFVYNDLVKRRVITKKKQVYAIIGVAHSNFNSIEKRERNYPLDKRMMCRAALLQAFGVNPEYLDGKSEIMYVKEPEPVTDAPVLDVVQLNFQNIAEKTKVLAELEEYKKQVAELQAENEALRVQISKLRSKPKIDK